jgi:hypothetical protein
MTSAKPRTIHRGRERNWARWLGTFVAILAGLFVACYAFVVLIDPFSTGRFALTQRIDRVPHDSWFWFAKAGLIRDAQFDAILLGSSVAGTLDPVHIGEIAGRNILQAALYGAFPHNLLTVSRAFDRHHAGKQPLRVITLEHHWCVDTVQRVDHRSSWLPEFPSWVYESPDYEYLMRIYSNFALDTAVTRLGIWLGLRDHSIPANGFAPILPVNFDAAAVVAKLLALKPTIDAPSPTAPFPHLDAWASHLASLDAGAPVLLVFVPAFVNALPPAGTPAAKRLAACKSRIDAIAKQRPNTAFLDLHGDNEFASAVTDYVDEYHFRGVTCRRVEAEIGKAVLKLLRRG